MTGMDAYESVFDRHPHSTAEGQRHLMRSGDPARAMGERFRAAEEMALTRADVDALIARDPERYGCLRYWRATDER